MSGLFFVYEHECPWFIKWAVRGLEKEEDRNEEEEEDKEKEKEEQTEEEE